MPADLDLHIRPGTAWDRHTAAQVMTTALQHCRLVRWLHPVAASTPSSLREYVDNLLTRPAGLIHLRVVDIGGQIAGVAAWTTCVITHFVTESLIVAGHHANQARAADLYTELAKVHPHSPHHHLLTIAVHPDHQRHGIGTALLGEPAAPGFSARPRHAVLPAHLVELAATAGYTVAGPQVAAGTAGPLYPLWRPADREAHDAADIHRSGRHLAVAPADQAGKTALSLGRR